jgi:hypothetical protein
MAPTPGAGLVIGFPRMGFTEDFMGDLLVI